MDRPSGAATANAKANANWWLKVEDDSEEKEEQRKVINTRGVFGSS